MQQGKIIKPNCWTIGFEETLKMLNDGSYISPRQVFDDTKHKLLLEWTDLDLFYEGVFDALKEYHYVT